MIFKLTKLKISDNSGIKKILFIYFFFKFFYFLVYFIYKFYITKKYFIFFSLFSIFFLLLIQCIRTLSNGKIGGKLGEIIIVCVKSVKKKSKVYKKNVYKALILSSKLKSRRLDDSFIKFDANRAIVLGDNFKLLGSKIFGAISKEVFKSKLISENLKKLLLFSSLII
jgi:large subunit ribosomal protein L14